MLKLIRTLAVTLAISMAAQAGTLTLQSEFMTVDIDGSTGGWSLLDKRSQVRWPSQGSASAGSASWIAGKFTEEKADGENIVRLTPGNGAAVEFDTARLPAPFAEQCAAYVVETGEPETLRAGLEAANIRVERVAIVGDDDCLRLGRQSLSVAALTSAWSGVRR